jgi:hypothetical protein
MIKAKCVIRNKNGHEIGLKIQTLPKYMLDITVATNVLAQTQLLDLHGALSHYIGHFVL